MVCCNVVTSSCPHPRHAPAQPPGVRRRALGGAAVPVICVEAGPGLGRVKLEVEVPGGLAPPERRGQQRQVARLGLPVGGALEVAWHNQYQAELR